MPGLVGGLPLEIDALPADTADQVMSVTLLRESAFRYAGRMLLLTFDDYFVRTWSAVRGLFTAYDARVSFFISEPDRLDAEEWRMLRDLAADGHTVGAHGWRHRWAPDRIAELGGDGYLAEDVTPCVELLRAQGFAPRSFAYPVSRHCEKSDQVLGGVFSRLRGGVPVKPAVDLSTLDDLFVPLAEVPSRRVLLGASIDTGKAFRPAGVGDASVSAALRRAADRQECLTLYGHAVADRHEANHTAPARVEAILAQAAELGLPCRGFDELDAGVAGHA
ncbi:polysaccharide deacetylase family protein [Nonomuraea sp. NPDC005983]|uniref:polysaccharide deacetylase family protein n=1 Tax=Nonomuraea sp. NPDC005983 TaxID=3155595 RepID=UPI0033B55B85